MLQLYSGKLRQLCSVCLDQRADSSDAATMVEYTIKGLESDVGYEVCVVAVNMAGQSSPPEGQEDTTEHEEYSVVVLRTALPSKMIVFNSRPHLLSRLL